MREQKRNFRNNLKRFFEPAVVHKKAFITAGLQVFVWPFYGVVTTLVLAKAVSYLQYGEKESFFQLIA